MSLKRLYQWPIPRTTRRLFFAGMILLVLFLPLMGFFFFLSGDRVPFIVSQLSFSGQFLTNQYSFILAANGLQAYLIAQLLDYGFMVSYALVLFSLGIMIARRQAGLSRWENFGYLAAIAALVAAICDGFENGIILATLTTPTAVPHLWAVAHSAFALLKYLIFIIVLGHLCVSPVLWFVKREWADAYG